MKLPKIKIKTTFWTKTPEEQVTKLMNYNYFFGMIMLLNLIYALYTKNHWVTGINTFTALTIIFMKHRQIFVFLLSSEDEIQARIEIRAKAEIEEDGDKIIVTKTLNNADITYETEEDTELKEKLAKEIKEKVKTKEKDLTDSKKEEKQTEIRPHFKIHSKSNKITAIFEKEFERYLERHKDTPLEILEANEKLVETETTTYIWELMNKKETKKVRKMIYQMLSELDESYNEYLSLIESETLRQSRIRDFGGHYWDYGY